MKGFGYLVKEGFKNVWSNRIMSIASVCVLISCLVLTGAASLFSLNVSKMVDEVGESNETIVYILDSYSQLEAIYVGKEIEKVDNVASATFYSKEEAFEQYRETLGDSLFSRIEDRNPLPDSFIVVMHDLSKYDETVAEIQKIPGVDPDTILNRKDFADKLTRISSLVNLISVAVVSALLVISLFIIANTIRATMYSRRFEISIMKSVGATKSLVRLPFLVEGMVIGLISAIIATGVLVLVYQGVGMVVENAQSMFDFIPILQVLPYAAAAFILFGIFVGFCGGFLSIRKYLKMEGNEILGW